MILGPPCSAQEMRPGVAGEVVALAMVPAALSLRLPGKGAARRGATTVELMHGLAEEGAH